MLIFFSFFPNKVQPGKKKKKEDLAKNTNNRRKEEEKRKMRPKRSNISKNMWKIQKTKCLVQNPRSWVFADKTLIFCESKPRNVEETAMHGGAKLHVWLWFCKQTASTYGPWLFSDFFKSWNGKARRATCTQLSSCVATWHRTFMHAN